MDTKPYLQVQNLNQLYAIQNHQPGEMAYVIETNEIMIWDELTGWTKVEVNQDKLNTLGLNLYELNKSVVGQLKPMTISQVSAKIGLLTEYHRNSHNIHYMLLCRDYNYYTLFECDTMLSFPDFASAVCTIITELGAVYSIEQLEDGAVEIWIQPTGEDTPYAFYLFPYDAGVVYYG